MTKPAIPEAPYEVFANPPLKAMLGQVRFPPILRIADIAALGAFQEHIRDEWPDFAQEQQISFLIGPGAPAQAAAPQAVSRFTSQDGLWSLVLAPDVLTLEAGTSGPYSSYEEFSKRFAQAWTAVLDVFRPSAITRQGLRYVDHIEGDFPVADWAGLINPELLGPVIGVLAQGLVQAVAEYRFDREDGLLVFKHGLVPAGPDNTPGYLLDFDYFTEQHSGDVSLDALKTRFDSYHDACYALFRWCVTDHALERFRANE
jgi:uncharacterized protein (TIGR04255 family)